MTSSHPAAPPGRAQAILGIALQSLSYLVYLVVSVQVVSAMRYLHDLPEGGIDPRELASRIGEMLLIAGGSVLIGLVGLILLTLALVRQRYRANWFYWYMVVYGALLLVQVPFGTVFGLYFLTYCLQRRSEFGVRP